MAYTYLQRSTTTRTNNQAYTFSCWFKRSALVSGRICINLLDGNNRGYISINGDSNLFCYDKSGGVVIDDRQSFFQLKDINGWYHYVQSVNNLANGSGGSVNDRFKTYLNGVDVSDQWTKNTAMAYNVNIGMQSVSGTNGYKLGSQETGSDNFNGLMSHVHFVDGLQLPASTFGETDATTGEWKIKTSPTVSEYGNNGFFVLKDGNSLTDQSGKGNNFTVGAGAVTKTEDSPSNVFATLNPLARRITNNAPNYSNGNTSLQGQTVDAQYNNAIATIGDISTGKFYWEVKVGNIADAFSVGISDTPNQSNGSTSGNYYVYYGADGNKNVNGSTSSYGASYTTNDIIGVAIDVTSGSVTFYKNGTSQGTADTNLITNMTHGYIPVGYTSKGLMNWNFGNGYFGTTAVASAGTNASGNGIFEYDVPTGFTALSTKGLNL
jgi:hypothetical protein